MREPLESLSHEIHLVQYPAQAPAWTRDERHPEERHPCHKLPLTAFVGWFDTAITRCVYIQCCTLLSGIPGGLTTYVVTLPWRRGTLPQLVALEGQPSTIRSLALWLSAHLDECPDFGMPLFPSVDA